MSRPSEHFEVEPESQPLFIESLAKAFTVLELFAGLHAELTMNQIREATGLTFQTIQRITNTLEWCGYLERNERTKAFRLALKTMDLQHKFLGTDRLVKVAWPVLVDLRERTGQRVSLCALDDTEIIYLLRLAGRQSDFQTSLIGRKRPAFCTAGGRAILSRMPVTIREHLIDTSDLIPLTPRSLTDRAEILARIAESEAQGFCVTEQETQLGENSAAVPIIGVESQVLGAVVISAPAQTHSGERITKEIVPLMQFAARAIALP